MKAQINHNNKTYNIDLSHPFDISISLRGDNKNPVAWYLEAPKIQPVRQGDFVGKVSEGASTNFNNIQFNPHAHGTHTECVGHITREFHSINEVLKTFFFTAKLISIEPIKKGEDQVITEEQVRSKIQKGEVEAVVIRTLPNYIEKRSRHYSHTNWPYLEESAARYLRVCGVKHLLIDLPSIDREKDEGKLLAHKAFWDHPKNTRMDATITEMIYVPNKVEDGDYILDLQVASFENDAAPSRPVLYKLE
ncbi:cyclase family protein [Antarcticibacterium flavum]|uniref:Cyclase family protein n=1 Tax=Antarcticibacterium flavum TaxID=2058175 RepID=A0A5B7X5W5_9FLAO|nr:MULTISPECIES: cyclase family protein [Antarcticibacterium]MCM4161905.1 metal-dependent hydrolase [Antarcticibacterium sp. W02-3]QCY70023.1 cyclase family protein [Antarcticibacterium flavum]